MLATTKTDFQLQTEASFSFGSFRRVGEAWRHLISFNDGALLTWLGNSALYCGVALVITLVVVIPAAYALGLSEFRGRKLLLSTSTRRDDPAGAPRCVLPCSSRSTQSTSSGRHGR